MSFGNLHLHLSGASRPEAGRPEAGHPGARRPQPSLPAGSASVASPSAARGGHERSRSESSVAFRGKSQTDLSVVTAEGDRITISLAAQVKYAASSQTGPDGSSQTVETASSSQLRVAVQGDLSEAELKDLGTLLNKLSQATSNASSTDAAHPSLATADASADPTGFAGLTSLAAFRYRYQQAVEGSSLVNVRG